MKNCKIVGKFKKGVSSIFYLLRNDQYLSLSNEYVKVFYYRKLQSSRWWKNANLLYTGKYKKNKIHDGLTPRVNEMEHIFNICHVFPVPYLWEKYELSREIFWKWTRNRFERPVIRVVRCSSYHVNFIMVCYWRFQATGKKGRNGECSVYQKSSYQESTLVLFVQPSLLTPLPWLNDKQRAVTVDFSTWILVWILFRSTPYF